MANCPQCGKSYTDAVKFCFSDGSPLRIGKISDLDGVADLRAGDRGRPVSAYLAPAGGITAAVILAAILFASWPRNARFDGAVVQNAVSGGGPEANASAANYLPFDTGGKDVHAATGNSRSAGENGDVNELVTKRIGNWERTAEARDLDAYMQNYAETVDYYRKTAASNRFVRMDKERAFSRFDSISLDIEIISITAEPGGAAAHAVIDKGWHFRGDRTFSGKVRQRISFRLADGQCLISGEKDLMVHYRN